VTVPAVPVPNDGSIRAAIDFTLKPEWSFDTKSRTFTSRSGETFSVRGLLPKGARLDYKVPSVARAALGTLNEHERDLRRYMLVILPAGQTPASYVRKVRGWPPVEEAHLPPKVSLPGSGRPA
jgi:hypothetical protein